MRFLLSLAVALATVVFAPPAPAQCVCAPVLYVTPINGCGCTLRITNPVKGISQCIFVPAPTGGLRCVRQTPGRCSMGFYARETGGGVCSVVFEPQVVGGVCGSYWQWTLPCSSGGDFFLQVACTTCPLQ